MTDQDREELKSYIEELRGDIRIAARLGNLGNADNLREALAKAKAEADLKVAS